MSARLAAAAIAALLIVQIVALWAMGHPLICACGHIELWHGAASDSGTSQHLTDWYSFSHVAHGLLFYALLAILLPRAGFAPVFVIAFALEAGWEIVENTPMIMERYRQTALAAGYYGDSVLNSVADTLSMALGFVIARVSPVWLAVALLVVMEIGMALVIRDNLTLNIIQLIHPFDAIGDWQAAG